MKFYYLFAKKQSTSIISMILLIYLILPLMMTLFQREVSIQEDIIHPVQALNDASSFNPRVFLSGSGRIHLIFKHLIKDGDESLAIYYHSYEHNNGSWSIPKKCWGDASDVKVFSSKPKEEGIVLYYFYSQKRANYDIGLYSQEFHEENGTWGKPKQCMGTKYVLNYLNMSETNSSLIDYSVYSLILLEDENSLIVWKFTFTDITTISHELEGTFIVSKIDINGTVTSEPIYGLKNLSQQVSLFFVQGNETLFLYNKQEVKRAVFLSNGSWSDWESFEWPTSMMGYWEHSLIMNRYLVWQSHYKDEVIEYPSGIVDLATVGPSNNCINLPPHVINRESGGIAVNLYNNNSITSSFITAIITNQTISLWKLDFWGQNSWNLLSTINNTLDRSHDQGYFNIDLISDDSKWRIFWDQKIAQILCEIFTISFDLDIEQWSSISQVTDTKLIIDDYYDQNNTSSAFVLLGSLLGLIGTVYMLKKRRK
jgi:hypothetical protein